MSHRNQSERYKKMCVKAAQNIYTKIKQPSPLAAKRDFYSFRLKMVLGDAEFLHPICLQWNLDLVLQPVWCL